MNSLKDNTGISGMALPHLYNLEAERVILGLLIFDNDNLSYINEHLSVDDFYEPAHRVIYEQISTAAFRFNITADNITFRTFFDTNDKLKSVGGSEYIKVLIEASTAVANIANYAKLISDLAKKRSLANIAREIMASIYKSDSFAFDADEQIEGAEAQLFNIKRSNLGSSNRFKSILSVAQEVSKNVEALTHNDNAISGAPTGFYDLDEILGGMQKSDLIILAARPSMGKTALAINIAINYAKILQDEAINNTEADGSIPKTKSVCIISLEMSSQQLCTRLISMESGIESGKLRTGQLTNEEILKIQRAANDIASKKIYIDDTPAISIATARSRLRHIMIKNDIGMVVVDYLQLLRGTTKQSRDSKVQEISEITQGLKAIAKEFNIPVIALSQLSRTVEHREDKRPQLSDLRESGTIEQDADVVMFIYRKAYYEERNRPDEGNAEKMQKWQNEMAKIRNRAELIIAKHRNGSIGMVNLYFDPNIACFKDYAGIYDNRK